MGIGPSYRCRDSSRSYQSAGCYLPSRVNILQHYEDNGHVLVDLQYKDFTNYSGRKILLYVDASFSEFVVELAYNGADPHFNEASFSPIARFEPTERGWELGKDLMKVI